ncbi:hypothetical protein R5R35_013225 [Gryllus longicercus]|uniref:Uncharacterized protein n=1 Tax=Gryllus longicercus TaxID=2509291 RepID=A0AAN9ZFQ4_9ORTH
MTVHTFRIHLYRRVNKLYFVCIALASAAKKTFLRRSVQFIKLVSSSGGRAMVGVSATAEAAPAEQLDASLGDACARVQHGLARVHRVMEQHQERMQEALQEREGRMHEALRQHEQRMQDALRQHERRLQERMQAVVDQMELNNAAVRALEERMRRVEENMELLEGHLPLFEEHEPRQLQQQPPPPPPPLEDPESQGA